MALNKTELVFVAVLAVACISLMAVSATGFAVRGGGGNPLGGGGHPSSNSCDTYLVKDTGLSCNAYCSEKGKTCLSAEIAKIGRTNIRRAVSCDMIGLSRTCTCC